MKPYADANFFTRLYLSLPESAMADRLVEEAAVNFTLPITWLLRCEILNAIELSVFVSRSGGPRISASQAGMAQANFREDLQAADFLIPISIETDDWRSAFEELALRHSARRGFRTYDLLHVASALELGCHTFWSFDRKARELAHLEGLAVNECSAA